MADLATLQTYLSEAETAYHKLNLGQLEARVQYEDKSVAYTQATKEDLYAYILSLREQIAALTGGTGRRPVLVVF